MHIRLLVLFFVVISSPILSAQDSTANVYLQRINKTIPHQFNALRSVATVEAVRGQGVVKIYMLVDDVEQYEQLIIERSDEMGVNFAQCGVVEVQKGKYKNNYVELIDRYPVSPKMMINYRLKTIDKEGNMRMLPPVPVQQATY
jgi:hypothetical protein